MRLFLAIILTAGLSIAATTTIYKVANVELGVGAEGQWEQWLVTNMCGQVETDFGLTGGTCTAATFRNLTEGVVIKWDQSLDDGAGKWVARTNVGWPHTTSPIQ